MGDATRDNTRIKTLQITYTDKNTSGIQIKPLKRNQVKELYEILVEALKEQQKQELKNKESINYQSQYP